jgi:hypothetical protein
MTPTEHHQPSVFRQRTPTNRTSLAFIKLWKTGSSSVQNVIYRVGDARNSTFVLPNADVFDGGDLTRDYPVLSCNTDRKMDIFALPTATGFAKSDVVAVTDGDPALVTLVRDPYEVFKSLTRYLDSVMKTTNHRG